jgi:hypothetical protein
MKADSFGPGRPYVTPPTSAQDTGGNVVPVRPLVAVQQATATPATLVFQLPAGVAWLVRRITVQSTIPGYCYVYAGGAQPPNLVSGTFSGLFDEDDTNTPIFVEESSQLTLVWPNGGAPVTGRIEYAEV